MSFEEIQAKAKNDPDIVKPPEGDVASTFLNNLRFQIHAGGLSGEANAYMTLKQAASAQFAGNQYVSKSLQQFEQRRGTEKLQSLVSHWQAEQNAINEYKQMAAQQPAKLEQQF